MKPEVTHLLWSALAGVGAAGLAWVLSGPMAVVMTPPPPWSGPVDGFGALAQLGRHAELRSHNAAADLESGNIGQIEKTGPYAYTVHLRSDNDDALPKYWRQWFYFRLDDVPTDKPVTLTVTGAGQWSYYVPFFSYKNGDERTWEQLSPKEVTQPTRYTLKMTHRFQKKTVWLARYVPYTLTTLQAYLSRLKTRADVLVSAIGRSPKGRTVPLVTITDHQARVPKARVVIHARTHPGEVGSSFLLEGLVNYLLSNAPLAQRLRQRLVFTIVPMLNVDGVVAGNNRVSPTGINLEGKWYPPAPAGAGLDLDVDGGRVPPEVRIFHDHLVALLREQTPVTMALNLHASAGEPEDNVFIFPHFGPEGRGYQPAEARLYTKQVSFIHDLCSIQGRDWFNVPPEDGTRSFLAKSVPETWWWRNFQDKVMALTIESTYGLAGSSRRWVKPDDMRRLGESLAKAIARYHGLEHATLAH